MRCSFSSHPVACRLPAILLFAVTMFAAGSATASDCLNTSVGFTPLDDLGTGLYQGFEGGLYPGGSNMIPAAHRVAGLAEALHVQPLDTLGSPDPDSGSVVFMSVGMCNTSQEFGQFMTLVGGFSEIHPQLEVFNGAQGGWSSARIADPGASFWNNIDGKLAARNLSPEQVQVVWFLEANARPDEPFPEHADSLRVQFQRTMNIVRGRYPNARLCYFSSRIYAGYASSLLNPEPFAYESGFAVKWLIEDQIAGNPDLNFDPDAGPVNSPWIAWGPYLWADGLVPRSDSLIWECADFQDDGTHPGAGAREKVANMLLDFFTVDETAVPWFLATTTGVSDLPGPDVPMFVHAAIPNPFGASTSISLDIAVAQSVRVDVFTASGRRLKTLVNRRLSPGTWTFEWDGTDSAGQRVGTGVYYLAVDDGEGRTTTRKITLVR